MYVVDAGVLVADVRPSHPHHQKAHTFLVRPTAEEETLLLPAIALAEVATAVSRGTGRRRLVVLLLWMPHIRFIPVDEPLTDLVAEPAAQHRIRGCDAVYIALARQHNAVPVTPDREQRERTAPFITVRAPVEEL